PPEPAAPDPAAAAAEPAARSAEAAAAERPDAAGPVAPRTAAPVAPPAPPAVAADVYDEDDDPEEEVERESARPRVAARRLRALDRHVRDGDAALLADAIDDLGRAAHQPLAGLPLPEFRPDGVAHFAGEAVGDQLLERVADLKPQRAIVHRDDDQQAVVLAFVANAAAPVLEHLDRVLIDAPVRLVSRHGRDDDRVSGRVPQRPNAPV